MIKIENEERIIEYEYDYRGRLMGRIERELPDGENVETVRMSYSGGTSVLEKDEGNTLRFYRGSDMGGGVGGVLYVEDADCGALKYKHYNLRGTLRTCFAIDKCFGNCIVKQNILNGAHYLNCGMLK